MKIIIKLIQKKKNITRDNRIKLECVPEEKELSVKNNSKFNTSGKSILTGGIVVLIGGCKGIVNKNERACAPHHRHNLRKKLLRIERGDGHKKIRTFCIFVFCMKKIYFLKFTNFFFFKFVFFF